MEKINKRRTGSRFPNEEFTSNNSQNQDKVLGRLIESTLTSFEKKLLDPSKFGRQELKNYMLKYHQLQITEVVAIEGILFCRG
jgi:hypothetical protein